VPGYRDPERSDWESIEELAGLLSPEDAQLFYQIAVKGRSELPLAPDPRTGLEMALLRMLAFRPAGAASAAPQPDASGTHRAPNKAGATRRRSAAGSGARRTGNGEPSLQPNPAGAPAAVPAAGGSPGAGAAAATTGSDWNVLLDQLELSGQVRELARNVQLKSHSDDRWDFLIAPALRHLGSAACVSRLSEAISDRVGHPVSVRIFDQDGGELQTVAALEQQQLSRSRSEAERAIRDDPTVRALQEQMGARLVEDSIQPLQ
jgi:DNA polymerase-3 subunit gamma/tau